MDVNYILIKGSKHFKCRNLAEIAIYFSLSITNNGSVICDGYHDTPTFRKLFFLWLFTVFKEINSFSAISESFFPS